jgi:hypothetical protein
MCTNPSKTGGCGGSGSGSKNCGSGSKNCGGSSQKCKRDIIGCNKGVVRADRVSFCSRSEGCDSFAKGTCSHAEGISTQALGDGSHAEGCCTKAGGKCSHAEGCRTKAPGKHSHAEGCQTIAEGECSHAGGQKSLTRLRGQQSVSSGNFSVCGDSQCSKYFLRTKSLGKTSKPSTSEGILPENTKYPHAELFIDGTNGSERLTIPLHSTWHIKITVTARGVNGQTIDTTKIRDACFVIKALVTNNLGTVEIPRMILMKNSEIKTKKPCVVMSPGAPDYGNHIVPKIKPTLCRGCKYKFALGAIGDALILRGVATECINEIRECICWSASVKATELFCERPRGDYDSACESGTVSSCSESSSGSNGSNNSGN